MIKGQPISARMDKPKISGSRSIRIVGTAVLLATALLPTFPAYGMDTPAPTPSVRRSVDALPLPPIPYLHAMPWLEWAPILNGLKIDTLQLPRTPLDGAVGDDICSHRSVALPTS
jgi:hypothetical protein